MYRKNILLAFLDRLVRHVSEGVVSFIGGKNNNIPDHSFDFSLAVGKIIRTVELLKNKTVCIQEKIVLRLSRIFADNDILLEAGIGKRIFKRGFSPQE